MLNVRKQNMFNQVHPFISYIASTPCIAYISVATQFNIYFTSYHNIKYGLWLDIRLFI
jgi:hypothetical protein